MKTPPIYQIYATNLSVEGAQPCPVGGFHRSREAAEEEAQRLLRLSNSPAYPMHGYAFTIREVD